MIRRPPRSTLSSSSAASDVYKRQIHRSTKFRVLKEIIEFGNAARFPCVPPARIKAVPNPTGPIRVVYILSLIHFKIYERTKDSGAPNIGQSIKTLIGSLLFEL